MSESVTISLGDEEVEVTLQQLAEIAKNGTRIETITVSFSKKLNLGNYQSEDFFYSTTLNFEEFWGLVPEGALADKEIAEKVSRAFSMGASTRIGTTLRSAYRTVFQCVLDRATQLEVPSLPSLQAEARQLNTPISFDPFDSRGLRKKKREEEEGDE